MGKKTKNFPEKKIKIFPQKHFLKQFPLQPFFLNKMMEKKKNKNWTGQKRKNSKTPHIHHG